MSNTYIAHIPDKVNAKTKMALSRIPITNLERSKADKKRLTVIDYSSNPLCTL